MNKIILIVCLIMGLLIISNDSYSQGYTPPAMVLGLSLDGNFATNDAHGTNFTAPETYNMIWGKGLTAYYKIGLGKKKNHRLTISAQWNTMVNDNDNKIPFFGNLSPRDPHTSYTIWTGAYGYEYAFNARCRNKQFLGVAITTNLIIANEGSIIQFDDAFRMGMQVTTGYEFSLGRTQQTSISVGLKYHLSNILFTQNEVGTLNDGSGTPGPGFWRRIGFLSLNVGFNFYTGVKPFRIK